MLYLLTGDIQIGKTTWLKELIAQADEQGVELSGFISPAVFEDGRKTGIDVLLLPQKETLRFADVKGIGKQFDESDVVKNKRPCMYAFHDSVIKAVNQHMSSIDPEHPAPGWLLIDELGFLEFSEQGGVLGAMRILDQGAYQNAIVVIRPSLLDDAQARWSKIQEIQVIYPGHQITL